MTEQLWKILRRLLWSWPGWDGAFIVTLLSLGLGCICLVRAEDLDTTTRTFLALGPMIGYFLRLSDERFKEITTRPHYSEKPS